MSAELLEQDLERPTPEHRPTELARAVQAAGQATALTKTQRGLELPAGQAHPGW